jgi:hypothetical protein
MSACRIYLRRSDGTIDGDETYVIETRTVERIERRIIGAGETADLVIEFDPPLIVAAAARNPEG